MTPTIAPETNSEFEQFLVSLKIEKSKGSYLMAKKVLSILDKVVNANDSSWQNAKELIELIVNMKNRLIKADPTETAPANISLRLLKIIRDEYLIFIKQQSLSSEVSKRKFTKLDYEEHLQKLLINEDEQNCDYSLHADKMGQFRSAVNDGINELSIELDTSAETIAAQSLEHIYSNELILTLGKSNSVEHFLKHAAKKRKFQVVVAEGSPFNNGHDLATRLSAVGINTTLIPDSAIFAMMSRVNKVVIGTHSVMANGGLKAVSGAYSVALAAKHYSVPLIVCTAMFKLTPQYLVSHDQVAFNKFSSPHQLLPFRNDRISTRTEVVNPVFDYVPPELVTAMVSNIGGSSPSYVYRLLTELYHSQDYLS